MRASALYVGRVRHRRSGDVGHAFSYPTWHALLDVDELPGLDRRLRWFSHNRFNLTGFDDRDHMRPERRPVRTKVEAFLRARGRPPTGGPIRLLTQLRVLGTAFTPVAFFFCHRPDGRLEHVIAEVNNTFGETHCYLLEAAEGRRVVAEEQDKTFHVSPFQPVAGRYRFRITEPGPRLTVHIDVLRDGRRPFDATLTATRRPLDDRTLVRTVVRHPHVAARTLGAIHWQALRLWLKRAPFFPKPTPPPESWRTRHG
jgi:DUF1365 family protein